MSDYTPTREEVRAVWSTWNNYGGLTSRWHSTSIEESGAEFDRWLAQVKTKALRVAAGDFVFADQVWRDYQGLPDQGYSHRDYLEHVVNRWLHDYANKLERVSND